MGRFGFLLICLVAAWPFGAVAKLESADVSLDYVAKKAEQRRARLLSGVRVAFMRRGRFWAI